MIQRCRSSPQCCLFRDRPEILGYIHVGGQKNLRMIHSIGHAGEPQGGRSDPVPSTPETTSADHPCPMSPEFHPIAILTPCVPQIVDQ